MLARQHQEDIIELINKGGLSDFRPCQITIGESSATAWAAQLRLPPKTGNLLTFLDAGSKLAKRVMIFCHQIGHKGVSATFTRSRVLFLIPCGGHLARSVTKGCTRCKLTERRFCMPNMGLLLEDIVVFHGTWSTTHLDLSGPFSVVDPVSKRSSVKIWVALFACSATFAVHAEVVGGYDTTSFISSLMRFLSVWHAPETSVGPGKSTGRE